MLVAIVIFVFFFAAAALTTLAIDALRKRLIRGKQAPDNCICGVDQAEILAGDAAHHRVPDYVSRIVAYRIWMWDGSKLKSLNGEGWRPNKPLVAKCLPGHSMVGSDHHAPHDSCTCGIYATKSPDPELTGWWLGIYGEVYLWGTVVEHESGWRAQYAYPKRLVLSPALVSPVLGTRVARSPWYCLAILTKYGADIYLADATGNIPLWLARSGYDIEGLKRFRKVIHAVHAENQAWNRALPKPAAKRFVRKRRERRKNPPGPPPPPPAVPVHSLADIIRIIQSRRDGWPAHWVLSTV